MVRGVIAASTAAGIEREVVLEAGRDVAHDAAGEDDRRHVGDIRRLVEDDLVARVARRAQREIDRLGGTDRDEDLGRRVVADAVAVVQVARQGAPQLDGPEVRRVVGPALAQALDPGLDDDPRRVEVGLPHPEADDVVHRRRDVEEAADPRRRHGSHALGQDALGERRSRVGAVPVSVAIIGKPTASSGGRAIVAPPLSCRPRCSPHVHFLAYQRG